MKNLGENSRCARSGATPLHQDCVFQIWSNSEHGCRRSRHQAGTHAEPLYICINVFFTTFGIFFSSGRGSFLVFSAPWHSGSPLGPNTQVWALAEVRGTCSGGSKWHVRSGRHSEHVKPSRCRQTHVQVKRMSDGMRIFFRILLAPRAGCLPTPRAHVRLLVLVPECYRARARVRVLECW